MSFVGTAIQCSLGTIAGVLKLGPFIFGQMFLSQKSLPPYNIVELGAGILDNDPELKKSNKNPFKDVYLTNSKDGTKLHAVIDDGTQRKPGMRPIVMVHGFPELWISWLDQMKHFVSKGHPILVLSMRGYGLSDKPSPWSLQPYHMYDYLVEDIRTAVTYITQNTKVGNNKDQEAPLLVAHDWGAVAGWSYVCQGKTTTNKEIAGYAALSIPPSECVKANMGLKQLWASLYMLFFNMPWLPEKIMLFNNAWLIGRFMMTTKRAILPPWMINAYRTNCLQPGAMTAQLNYYRSLVQRSPKPNKEDVLGPKKDGQNDKTRLLDLPVLIIRGKNDDALTEDVFVGYDRYLSNARLVALEECSHWIQADCPNEVNTELEKFLAKISSQKPQ